MLRVGDHRELQAVTLAMKGMRRDLAKDLRREAVQTMKPEWVEAVRSNAVTNMDRVVLTKGARIASGNPPVMVAASSKRQLSGGLRPVEHWAAFEFGANRNRVTTYSRRNRKSGGTHKVTRHTTRQLPRRAPDGRVVYPAVKEIVPRLASLWVQIVVRRTHEAAEGR